MPFQRPFLFAAVFRALAVAGDGQSPGWKSLHLGKLSLNYPPTWNLTEQTRGPQTLILLTPDSMQHLGMRMIELYELPLSHTHSYETFKKDFTAIVSGGEDGTTFKKMEEITFKDHQAMYAEIIQHGLPAKVYAINTGTFIYPIVLFSRRYSEVPDPGLERDETAILNSITFDQ